SAVSQFGAFGDMRHLYFTPDFSSEDFGTRQFGTRTVSWLTALPVSDAELKFAEKESTAALEEKLAAADFDWSNIARQSVL
ncbi:MAG: suppressor of fused domain protein, partial [Beijerinckiaceae bacterium]